MSGLNEKAARQEARIKVIGVGGGGNNAVNSMISAGLKNVEFYVANTDLQALENSPVQNKIQLGAKLSKGLGVGADPEMGRKAAMEDIDKIEECIGSVDMVFITAGLGGGTGTGGAPVIASIAKELNVLTVGVVTKPFNFEGRRRMKQAEEGLLEIREHVDTLITIPNQRLLNVIEKNTTIEQAFKMVDDVLFKAVKGISDLITIHGFINLDFADVRTIMKERGMAIMGTGWAKGERRAEEAVRQAINSPLLEDTSIKGAKGVLLNITGGPDLTLFQVNEISSMIEEMVDEDANIIFGAVRDENMVGEVQVTVIATGFGMEQLASAAKQQVTHKEKSCFKENVKFIPEVDKKVITAVPFLKVNGHREFAAQLASQEDLDIPTFMRKRCAN